MRLCIGAQPFLRNFSKAVTPTVSAGVMRVDAAASTPPSLTRRRVYIYQPSLSTTQSGALHADEWRIDFDNTQARWENPLMGWTSSRDPVQGVALKFETQEQAVRFAERQGWECSIRSGQQDDWKRKSYADNFLYSAEKLKLIRTK